MLRLRQICLATAQLEPAVQAVEKVFGLRPCHSDSAVAKYGLANALFVFGDQFLEIVAPLSGRADASTAAGRFIEKSGGRGGYMAIFDTSDPQRRKAHVEALGLRIAHVMDYPEFWGFQIHPRDGRGTMLEFDRTVGNENIRGNYWPAGPHWLEAQKLENVRGIPAIEMSSPNPGDLASHWSRIIGVPCRIEGAMETMHFDLGSVRFVQDVGALQEHMSGMEVAVGDRAATLQRARDAGLPVTDRDFGFCGVRIVPV